MIFHQVKVQFNENLQPLKQKRKSKKKILNNDKSKNNTVANIDTNFKKNYRSLIFEGRKNELLKSIFEDDDDEFVETHKITQHKKKVAIQKGLNDKDNNKSNYSRINTDEVGQNLATNEETPANKITSYFNVKAKKSSSVREKKHIDINSTTSSQSTLCNPSNILSEISNTSDQQFSQKSLTSSPLIDYESPILKSSVESPSQLTTSNSHPTKPPSISRNPLKITPHDELCDHSDTSASSFNNKFFHCTSKNPHMTKTTRNNVGMKVRKGMFDITDTPVNSDIGKILVPDTPEIHYGKSVKCLQLMKCKGLYGVCLLEA